MLLCSQPPGWSTQCRALPVRWNPQAAWVGSWLHGCRLEPRKNDVWIPRSEETLRFGTLRFPWPIPDLFVLQGVHSAAKHLPSWAVSISTRWRLKPAGPSLPTNLWTTEIHVTRWPTIHHPPGPMGSAPHGSHRLGLSQGGQVASRAVAHGIDLPHAGVLVPRESKAGRRNH